MLSGAKNVAGTLQNDKFTPHSQCQTQCQTVSRRVVLTAKRIVFAINLADKGRTFQARAAATGKAWSPSVERRVYSTISVDEEDRRRRRISTSV